MKRFIYVSSMSAVSGFDNIIEGTEDSVPFPEKLILPEYGITKRRAERMVLESNCELGMSFFDHLDNYVIYHGTSILVFQELYTL